jgi:hypothetical protein
MQVNEHGYLTTTVDSPFDGQVTFNVYTPTRGEAFFDGLTVNRIELKGRVALQKHETATNYAEAGDVGISYEGGGDSIDRKDFYWSRPYKRDADKAPSGARKKVCDWVYKTAKDLWTTDVSDAALAAEVARELESTQGKIAGLLKQVEEARERELELVNMQKSGAAFCGAKAPSGNSRTCRRPAGHTGSSDRWGAHLFRPHRFV